jgi:hypothetical protein
MHFFARKFARRLMGIQMKAQYKKKLSTFVAVVALTLGAGFSSVAWAQAAPFCGPMDVVFVVDDTGSMDGAISNVKLGISSIADDVVAASGGDYQMAVVSFSDAVETDEDLAPGNEVAVKLAINALFASGGLGAPEASDAALDTVVNGTSAGSDAGPCNQPFNSAGFRPGAVKIAVMLTDNLPGGCNDAFTVVDDVNAARVANDAAAAGILISAIYNEDSPSATTVGIMTNYAATTGGVFVNTPSNGDGTAAAIEEIIAACGSSANTCPLSQGYWKNHLEAWPESATSGMTIGGVFYTPWQLLTVMYTPPKKGNSYLQLGHQHIAALLNVAHGANQSVIADSLAEAESILTGVNMLSDYIRDNHITAVAGMLDDYNTRALTPDCEESENN